MFELPSSRAKGDLVTSTQTNTSQTVLKSTDYVPPHAQVVSYVLRYSILKIMRLFMKMTLWCSRAGEQDNAHASGLKIASRSLRLVKNPCDFERFSEILSQQPIERRHSKKNLRNGTHC